MSWANSALLNVMLPGSASAPAKPVYSRRRKDTDLTPGLSKLCCSPVPAAIDNRAGLDLNGVTHARVNPGLDASDIDIVTILNPKRMDTVEIELSGRLDPFDATRLERGLTA